jgi:colanic acid biosynthesis glycosyl transferase WcaI
VVVVTSFASRAYGRSERIKNRLLFRRETHPLGYKIIRCFSFVSRHSRILSRFCENISFGLTSGVYVLFARRPNLIYSNTWPILATGILFLVSALRKIRVVASVQDVYPESMISQKKIGADKILVRIMRWIDGKIARSSYILIVISDAFKKIYVETRQVVPEKIRVIPNWVAAESVIPDSIAGAQLRNSFGISIRDFMMVYGGNIGEAAGVETLIRALHHLGDFEKVHLLIAGEGSSLEHCKELANSFGCKRITFISPWHETDKSAVLSAADLLMLPTKGKQSRYSMPSKMITYLLAARPIIALAFEDTDTAKEIKESNCGWIVNPDDPLALAEKIACLMNMDPPELKAYGKRGRNYALGRFVRDVCAPKVADILEQAEGSR